MPNSAGVFGGKLHKRLQKALLGWYSQHKRDLPWRGETDPYRILLSEVLLQQTRVDQAIPYYRRFLAEFPTLEALGQADLEAVLEVWQGLGYYARARNLHKLAQALSRAGGQLPRTYHELLQLPGLGPYTAAAVASMAFGERVAVVDGNVRRVIARWMAWQNPSPKQVQDEADELMAVVLSPTGGGLEVFPGDWNQALMELGATVCIPKNPRCGGCPVAQFCQGKTSPERYPAAKQRLQKPVEVVALVLVGPQGVHLELREGRILGGLWGFPMEEGAGALPRLLGRFGLEAAELVGTVRHAFTHRKLRVQVYWANKDAREQPENRPLSRLDRKILELIQSQRNALL